VGLAPPGEPIGVEAGVSLGDDGPGANAGLVVGADGTTQVTAGADVGPGPGAEVQATVSPDPAVALEVARQPSADPAAPAAAQPPPSGPARAQTPAAEPASPAKTHEGAAGAAMTSAAAAAPARSEDAAAESGSAEETAATAPPAASTAAADVPRAATAGPARQALRAGAFTVAAAQESTHAPPFAPADVRTVSELVQPSPPLVTDAPADRLSPFRLLPIVDERTIGLILLLFALLPGGVLLLSTLPGHMGTVRAVRAGRSIVDDRLAIIAVAFAMWVGFAVALALNRR
jgi:hypothetical protein